MPVITAQLTTVSLADSTTGWSGTSGQLDTEVYKQAATIGSDGAYTYQTTKSALATCTYTPGTNINMTANYTNPHLYWTMRCDVFPFCEALNTGATNSGLMVRVTDGAGNYKQWHVTGSDEWDGSWRTFVLDLTSTASHSSSGTLSLADVDIITWYTDNSNSGNIRIIDNTWLDAVRYGDGLQLESATTEAVDFTDIANDDQLTANYYGVAQLVDGVIFVQGALEIGDSAGSANCNFVSSGETVYFRDQLVGTAHYAITFVEGTGSTDVDIDGLVCKTVGATAAEFDASATALTSFTMDASTFIDMGAFDFYVGTITSCSFSNCGAFDLGVSTFTADSCVFNLCGLITQNGASIDDCTISSPDGTGVLSDDPAQINGCTFISDGTGHGIEIDTAGTYSFIGNTFSGYGGTEGTNLTPSSGSTDAAIYNNSGGLITLNISGGGSTPSIRNAASSTTQVNNTKTLTMKNVPSGVQVTIVNTAARTERYNQTSTGADMTYGHSGGEVVDILLMGLAYDPNVSDQLGITLPNDDSEINFSMLDDLNYENPPP